MASKQKQRQKANAKKRANQLKKQRAAHNLSSKATKTESSEISVLELDKKSEGSSEISTEKSEQKSKSSDAKANVADENSFLWLIIMCAIIAVTFIIAYVVAMNMNIYASSTESAQTTTQITTEVIE